MLSPGAGVGQYVPSQGGYASQGSFGDHLARWWGGSGPNRPPLPLRGGGGPTGSGGFRQWVGLLFFLAVLYALLALVVRRPTSASAPPPSAPAPAPPPPAPAPWIIGTPPAAHPPEAIIGPEHNDGTTAMMITNNEWADGVVFCRGPVNGSMAEVYFDHELKKHVVGSEYDVSDPSSKAAQQWGAGVPGGCTLALGLSQGSSTTLYIRGNGTWPSGACWFQDVQSNAMVSLAKGPQYMSQVEFTIDRSGEGAVWYDMSSVEGVSGGITMNYTDASGNAQTDVAIPGKFSGSELRVVPAPGIGFPTVLSDKNVQGSCECESFSPSSNRCNTDACYASCPGPLVDNPCGQHRCREWYARQYEDSSSYCGWLYAEGAQTYCWAMDEWKCVDADCGYGGEGQPRKDCSSRYPEDAPANSYSCGHGGSMPGPNGTQWWTSGAGCEDKLVRGVPTNPAPPRNGGRIAISFENLPWLHE